MSMITISAPLQSVVISIGVNQGEQVSAGQSILVLEAMKVQTTMQAPVSGTIESLMVAADELVQLKQPLVSIKPTPDSTATQAAAPKAQQLGTPLSEELQNRLAKTTDQARIDARNKRHSKGFRTARENLADLCDIDSFIEYGQLAVAAQRDRTPYEVLQTSTPADGILTGIGSVNEQLFAHEPSKVAIIINDYSVLAGTQGYFHHHKLDRILAVATEQSLPVIMFTEGGGGRPGDTEVTVVNSGLQCASFGAWAALDGVVPRIAIANGYNFAGNAALFGAADITIATQNSWVGMAGPAMIAGGGLGDFRPNEIGPVAVQAANGVVDIVAADEAAATASAKACLAWFQGSLSEYHAVAQESIGEHLPSSRRAVYPVRALIKQLFDTDSVIELRPTYGGAIVTCLARLNGQAVGVMASDCQVLGGAIDVQAGEKAAEFMDLCNQFNKPLISICDTPGFMVGPQHEELGAVRRLAKLFTAGAKFKPPLLALVLRKCYGLGAQALLGGSTARPDYIAAWPSGEFGPMGLEGAVKLGFKKELDDVVDEADRKRLFDQLLAQQYARGKAIEVASVLEIDAVIEPAQSRQKLSTMLAACKTC